MRRRLMIVLAAVAAGVVLAGVGWVLAGHHGSSGLDWLAGWGDPARALVAQAAQAEAKADWAQAAALAERVLKEHPTTASTDRALLVLGDAYAHQGRLIEAKQAYQRLLTERTDSAVVGQAQEQLG